LRVLQESEVVPIGADRPIRVDVRIVAATHRDLRQLIRLGQFREDLYYRLNVVPIRLPPLRERLEDVPDLVHHFLSRVAQEGLPQKQIEPTAIARLRQHRWPGNVRELENLVRRLVALYTDDVIRLESVEMELADISAPPEPEGGGATVPADEGLETAVERVLKRYFDAHDDLPPPPGLYDRVLREVEAPLIRLSLASTRGNQIQAAKMLGLNRNTLRKKIKDLGIPVIRGLS
ncbi:MAG: sigma 54-interacting transcriptional regulator, partial [Alphaproteobacteria bacterium]|nr:sigma 54-interacting transcriptional regulator [Alphaproteobacteria bacterium]